MYHYDMVKPIHDQRMRQFMIEAERSHLLRQLRRSRPIQSTVTEQVALWLRSRIEVLASGARVKRLSS